MKDISVIIVSWNGCSFLRGCLQSIRDCSGDSVLETIVIDNASTDGSSEMVRAEFPEVTLICSENNLGFAKANNLGLRHAKGSYLALINSDVLVHPGCLESLSDTLRTTPDIGLVGPRVFGGDGRVQPTCRRFPGFLNSLWRAFSVDTLTSRLSSDFSEVGVAEDPRRAIQVDALSGCFWLARRSAVERVGGLDERFFFYSEDLDWCKRMWAKGWRVCFVPSATATHFGGGSSENAPLRFSVELVRANLLYWRKHHGFVGMSFFYFSSVIHHCCRMIARGARLVLCPGHDQENRYKLRRSWTCVRWLITGKGA